jgi:UDP-N-acetylmuramoyl-L-alanyl-D-glutamate--2,6-diaminopimelate ligase
VRLDSLLRGLPDAGVHGPSAVELTSLTYDSRRAGPGSLFVAITGFTVDGHDYVSAACRRGAAAVVVERGRPIAIEGAVTVVEVDGTRRALSALAAAWYGHPGHAMRVIGVTGTDGKTTTSSMIAALLEGDGAVTGLTGTARFKIGPVWEENATRQTTLEAPEIQELLARMRDAGVTDAVVESSSHGLALHKLDDCGFDIAVVTNVGADHLDFHGTRDAYVEAKARLLDLVATGGKAGPRFAVLNADDRSFAELRPRARVEVISYGMEGPADLYGRVVERRADGSRVVVAGRRGEAEAWVPMPGSFNVANALAALAVGLGCGLPLATLTDRLARFEGVPGRMAAIRAGQPFAVIVDYAHTGPAMRKLLATMRPLTAGRLIAVFGSAGEQSYERRAGLADAAADLTDFAVITSEDPRFEDPDRIIADIAAAMAARGAREGERFVRVSDRREAIRRALTLAEPGDLIVLCGKGHEQSIIVRDQKLPWDERQVALEELAALGFSAPPGAIGEGA